MIVGGSAVGRICPTGLAIGYQSPGPYKFYLTANKRQDALIFLVFSYRK
jgi:hypothetical protein